MAKYRNILGIEIENPYRYRAYRVGEYPYFDVQNERYLKFENKRVKGISGNPLTGYDIIFEDDKKIFIQQRVIVDKCQ